MRWSTAGVEALIRRVLVPLGALGVFVAETRQDEPRGLLIAAAVTLMIGQPVAALLDRREAHGPGPGDPPPSAIGPTGDRSS